MAALERLEQLACDLLGRAARVSCKATYKLSSNCNDLSRTTWAKGAAHPPIPLYAFSMNGLAASKCAQALTVTSTSPPPGISRDVSTIGHFGTVNRLCTLVRPIASRCHQGVGQLLDVTVVRHQRPRFPGSCTIRSAALTASAPAGRPRLARLIESMSSASIREIVNWGTPDCPASSAWERWRSWRNCLGRIVTGDKA